MMNNVRTDVFNLEMALTILLKMVVAIPIPFQLEAALLIYI